MSAHRRLIAVVVVALALVQAVAFAEPSQSDHFRPDRPVQHPATGAVPGRLIVGLRDDGAFAARSHGLDGPTLARRWGTGVRSTRLPGNNIYRVDVPQTADLEALRSSIARDEDVAYVEPDYIYHAMVKPNDEFYSRLYAFPRIGAEATWDRTTGSPSVLIAVVDTGVYAGHPDLAGNVVAGTNFVNGNGDASDDEGHGTHTAGIIAAIGNNGRGVAGMCWQCHILPIKALDKDGSGSASNVSASIRYAVDRGARVINLSLGGEKDSRLLHDAISYATNHGALVVVAAGNEAEEGNPVEYPAAYPEVIAVAATDAGDQHASFSNYNSYVAVSAPGVNIGSTIWAPDDKEAYAAASGTSEAAPFVSGLAGLIWSVNPSLSNDDVKRIILSTADDLGVPGPDPYFGAGRIDALRAITAATPRPAAPAAPAQQSTSPSDGITFPETGHTLRGDFRRFWETNGGLPVFGFPITEEQVEQTPEGSFTVQYFERNRFELHPEKAPPYNVLLGRLGDTILRQGGVDWSTLPRAQPASGCEFFAETGHKVCEPFLSYWRGHGLGDGRLSSYGRSLALFGLPLTEPRMETNSSGDTVMTQWFERARFEDHGSGTGKPGVLLGLLGNEFRTPAPTASSCPDVPVARDGRIRPSACLALGTEMRIDINGFKPGEQIAFWLTSPDNKVFGGERTITAGPDGSLADQRYPTNALSPGRWYWVFQGKESGHQSIIFFYVYKP